MRVCDLVAVLALASIVFDAGAEPRPPLIGVSSIRIANYGAPSVLVERGAVRSIVDELNRLRRKDWQRADAKLACYSTVVLLQGTKRVGEFRVRPEHVVERPVEKGQSIYSIAIDRDDVPGLSKLLAEIAPAKDCN